MVEVIELNKNEENINEFKIILNDEEFNKLKSASKREKISLRSLIRNIVEERIEKEEWEKDIRILSK